MIKFLPKNEGIDHINIYSKSKFWLGRQLSNFAKTPFECEHGKFQSVEGYWYWLNSGKIFDELKDMHGYDAKKFGKSLIKTPVENFDEYIKEAIRCKLRQHKNIRLSLKKSHLPLTHYYYFGGIEKPDSIIYLEKHFWIVKEIERLRILLKNS